MISVIIDLLLLGIVVYCGWQGLKRGLVNSAFGIVALVIAIFFGHLAGVVYSDQFSSMLKPFVNGFVDSAISTVTEDYDGSTVAAGDDGEEDGVELPVVQLTDSEKQDVYSVCFAALRELGISEKVAESVAAEVAEERTVVDQEMALDLSIRLCDRLAYVLVLGVIFAIFAIIGAIIGNVMNLYFKIPNLESFNKISGSVLGVIKGIIIIIFIACFCRYFGIILSNNTISKTVLLEFLIEHNKLASILGI